MHFLRQTAADCFFNTQFAILICSKLKGIKYVDEDKQQMLKKVDIWVGVFKSWIKAADKETNKRRGLLKAPAQSPLVCR